MVIFVILQLEAKLANCAILDQIFKVLRPKWPKIGCFLDITFFLVDQITRYKALSNQQKRALQRGL